MGDSALLSPYLCGREDLLGWWWEGSVLRVVEQLVAGSCLSLMSDSWEPNLGTAHTFFSMR